MVLQSKSMVWLALVLGLSACASTSTQKQACQQRDWFELGRHDGAQGSTEEKFEKHTLDCRKQVNASDVETMYTNGRNAGLVEYCTPENAFELGRMGLVYMYVCPSTVEPKFLSAYRKGQRARDLEIENKKLDGKIETMAEKLNQSANEFERLRITSEIAQLQAQRDKNQKEIERAYSKRQ